MGVPALFRWLSKKYPKIISAVIEDQPGNVDGQEIPVDTTKANPNGEEFDNLYLDMNGIVHPCSHPEDRPPPANEEEMMLAVFNYTDRVVNMVRPRKLLLIAVGTFEIKKISDLRATFPLWTATLFHGVAPRAKMNQQRSRRFRSAQEAKEKDEDKEEFLKMLKSQNGGIVAENAAAMIQKKTWDSNSITPGTPFMDILAASLRYWCAYKVNTDPAWETMKVIISDATVPGEGEHKIMEFIRSQRSSPEHDPNTRHVIYGLDADLIMLGLATHEPHFRVLREDVFFQESKARTCRICGQKGHVAEACKGEVKQKDGDFGEKDNALVQKPFIWLHVSILREYLAAEMYVPHQPFDFDLERALDDWVFMCFFVGNDFLPHLPSLDIKEDGIDTLIAIWRDNIPLMGGYVTKDGHVDLKRAQFILDGLAKQEDTIFRRRRQTEERRNANAKRRKIEEQNRENSRNATAASYDGNGRRKSPDYSPTPNGGGRGKALDPRVAPPGLALFKPSKAPLTKEDKAITHEFVVNRGAVSQANQANKSAAAVLKSQMQNKKNGNGSAGSVPEPTAEDGQSTDQDGTASAQTPISALGKRKAELMEDDETGTSTPATPDSTSKPTADPDELPPDSVRMWEEGYADRYYEQKFKVDAKDIAFRNKVASSYVEGLAWVLLYYFQGCPSWTWYYPYHYAPFAADFVDLERMEIKFEKGRIFKPFEQLMGVLPAASNHAIPEVFRSLMSDEDSEILDFYPTEFPLDLNGKKFAWQGVALLPFIDEKRLLDAMAKRYPLLSPEDAARNEMGKDALIISDRHPLYEEIAMNFYSKRQGSPKYKLSPRTSGGLAGKVEKNEHYLPQSSLTFPLQGGGMPDLEDDHSITVHYEIPASTHIHKSMLLRGVQPPPPTLTREDIEATKGRAAHSGRSFGGVPLRNNNNHNGGGRGGRGNGGGGGNHINYAADNRQNPFAPHLNPGFVPPTHFQPGGRGMPPPPPPQHHHMPEWGPPPPQMQGYGGGFNGFNPPMQQQPQRYGGGYGQPRHPPPPQHMSGYYGDSRGYGPPPPPRDPRYNNGDPRFGGYNGYR
ncbi:MAG: hypothetical protein Q9219_003985 [cf. Caloplaca sp. 3 TL-2023]